MQINKSSELKTINRHDREGNWVGANAKHNNKGIVSFFFFFFLLFRFLFFFFFFFVDDSSRLLLPLKIN